MGSTITTDLPDVVGWRFELHLERSSVVDDLARRADEPLDPALSERRLFRDDEPRVAVDREYISDLRRPVLAVADALPTAGALHDDFVDRHVSVGGAGLG